MNKWSIVPFWKKKLEGQRKKWFLNKVTWKRRLISNKEITQFSVPTNRTNFNLKKSKTKWSNPEKTDYHALTQENLSKAMESQIQKDPKAKETSINSHLKTFFMFTNNKCKQTDKIMPNSIWRIQRLKRLKDMIKSKRKITKNRSKLSKFLTNRKIKNKLSLTLLDKISLDNFKKLHHRILMRC